MHKSSMGLIFVHGIVGNNNIFQFLKPLLPAGCEYVAVTLAGHGGDALDFSKASMKQWQAQLAAAIEDTKWRCRKVLIVGHSMGCLLAIMQAAQMPVDGLFLLNPALNIRIKPEAVSLTVKVFFDMGKGNEHIQVAKDCCGVDMDYNLLHYRAWPMRFIELLQLAHRTRKLLRRTPLSCNMRVMIAKRDEVVSPASSRNFEGQDEARVVFLPDSFHFYYSESDKATITAQFSDFLESV